MDEVERRAQHIAARSAEAVTMTKRMMMNRSMESSMEAILDDELAAQSFLFGATGSQRGIERFLAMRRDRPRN